MLITNRSRDPNWTLVDGILNPNHIFLHVAHVGGRGEGVVGNNYGIDDKRQLVNELKFK